MKSLNIKEILEELYKLDPSLEKEEEKLTNIIQKIAKLEPKVSVDSRFVERLKGELLLSNKISLFSEFYNAFSVPMKIGVGSLALVAVVATGYLLFDKGSANKNNLFTGMNQNNINKLAAGAFGDLGSVGILNGGSGAYGVSEQASLGMSSSRSAIGFGGGGGIASSMSFTTEQTVADKSMIAPIYQNYTELKYVGGEFEIPSERMSVYERVKDNFLSQDLAKDLLSKNFGFVNLSNLNNAKINTIQLNYDKDNYVYVDLYDGRISINKNTIGIYGEDGSRPISELPDNSELFNISKKFLNDFGIDLTKYGEPSVDERWKTYYPVSSETLMPTSFPEVLTIVYPTLVNGNKVYNTGGGLYGLYVNVSVRNMEVVSVSDITSMNFSSSDYEVETDKERIIKIAEQGGIQGIYWWSGSQDKKTLELGKPEMTYMLYNLFRDGYERPQELYLPALSFPIINSSPSDYFYQNSIIVPIVKDILDGYENQNAPRPEILYMKDGAGTGSVEPGVAEPAQ